MSSLLRNSAFEQYSARFLENTKENPENTKDFFHRANPRKRCRSRKHSKDQGNSQEEKHQGKEGQGSSLTKIVNRNYVNKLVFPNLLTSFHASFFPFCPLRWPPLFLPISRHLFALLSLSKSALFCRAKGAAQSLERGNSGMDLSTKFGKEIPSRNLREKRSVYVRENGEIQHRIDSSDAIRRY